MPGSWLMLVTHNQGQHGPLMVLHLPCVVLLKVMSAIYPNMSQQCINSHDNTNNHGKKNSDQGAASIHGPTSPYGSSNNLHRVSSQVSLDAIDGHQNSVKWKRVSHNRPKANDSLRGSRRLHGTASSNKVSGTSDPHGYLFISRISRDTNDEDMLEWIETWM